MKKVLTITLLTLFLFGGFASPALAQVWSGKYDVQCNQSGADPCEWCDAVKVTANIVDFLTKLAFGVSALFIAVGAILIMVSGANEERYKMGKNAVTNAIYGLVITLSAWLIVNTIVNILAPGDGNFLPWSEIQC